jgi:hypothetical protein
MTACRPTTTRPPSGLRVIDVHYLLHTAREAGKGPVAATGAVIGVVLALIFGFMAAVPSGCAPEIWGATGEGLTFICPGEPGTVIGAGIVLPVQHAISWVSIAAGGLIGALGLPWLVGRSE